MYGCIAPKAQPIKETEEIKEKPEEPKLTEAAEADPPPYAAAESSFPIKPRLLGTIDGETLFLILLVYLLITEKSDLVLIAALVYILI
ncbi:MAG: hypothetical protein IJ446_04920 [Oscillospiraceae bacterium]|nr:hypothetical protein [Oscillospiraceae bacterium]